jgi:small subunit ribosomal protein S11
MNFLRENNIKTMNVILKGFGPGRDAGNDVIKQATIDGTAIVPKIEDKTGYPHNGCRAPKKRRV